MIPKKRGRPKKTVDTLDVAVPEPAAVVAGARGPRTGRGKGTQEDQAGSSSKATAVAAHATHSPAHYAGTADLPKKRSRTKKVRSLKLLINYPGLIDPFCKASSPARRPVTPPPLVDESSDDELLLTPSKKTSARLTTPMLTGGSRVGTPRLVMHSVEITTPRRLLNTARRDFGSPGPRIHVPPLGTPRLPPAFPAAGLQKRIDHPPPLTARSTAARTPSLEPRDVREEPALSPIKTSPSKRSRTKGMEDDGLPKVIPPRLHPLVERQRRAMLKALQRPPELDEIDVYGEDYPPTNRVANEQLSDLLIGTVTRGEGNSCLLIGPSGSGKTQIVEEVIAALPGDPIIVRLSGYAQQNDRLAIREIAWQLAQQTGRSFLPTNEEDEDEDEEDAPDAGPVPRPTQDADDNPFIDPSPAGESGPALSVTLPPPAHLLALISMIPTLPRPTVVVLDGFDLFASHARQALLYCLLDTAQACRAGPSTAATGTSSASGMAVIGVTTRVDTINLLEKRVKSRFSGRMIRTAGATKIGHWVALARAVLSAPVEPSDGQDDVDKEAMEEWSSIWEKATGQFLANEVVLEAFRETYALTRDYQMLRRILTSGHDVFTFEMLHEAFKNQVRTSQSAPVQIEGGGIGMVRCSREVLFAAFERLADLRIFLPAGASGVTVGREFALYRSAVDRFAVKKAVETLGQLNLKKWFTKAQ
ncbi:hypothetical protein BN946_scf184759.g14 [Trametes cinnabarina]|uniref:Origin recognition complex subunit 4 n=1 Tax=Pycnoporus cinnabarinus TaxID=5643 RepID=A0A060SBB1_PYCCI|nr:hypothetical protein BN946_scf184759.g14 [Trametes cinnabarina]